MKVLVVDDEFVSRTFLQEILQSYGSVHTAVNGVEAIDAVRLALDAGTPYDLICMDLLMPIMDGQRALEGIRALGKKRGIPCAKVILTTALESSEDAGRVGRTMLKEMDSCCDGHLVKPIKKAVLVSMLRELGLVSCM